MVEWTRPDTLAGPVHAVPAKSDCEPWEPWAPEKIVQRWAAGRYSRKSCAVGEYESSAGPRFLTGGNGHFWFQDGKVFFLLAKRIHHG